MAVAYTLEWRGASFSEAGGQPKNGSAARAGGSRGKAILTGAGSSRRVHVRGDCAQRGYRERTSKKKHNITGERECSAAVAAQMSSSALRTVSWTFFLKVTFSSLHSLAASRLAALSSFGFASMLITLTKMLSTVCTGSQRSLAFS